MLFILFLLIIFMLFFFFFFFFQAEDGIRDTSVTGVQTCALPIWRRGTPSGWRRDRPRAGGARADALHADRRATPTRAARRRGRGGRRSRPRPPQRRAHRGEVRRRARSRRSASDRDSRRGRVRVRTEFLAIPQVSRTLRRLAGQPGESPHGNATFGTYN